MQTKGFIRVITIALILICAFYLSFTFVSNHYQGIAEQKALKVAGLKSPDTSNDVYRNALNNYLDSIGKEKVYLGYYTFQQVREKELGLGLDLKGGMNVTLQISVPDILRALSGDNPARNSMTPSPMFRRTKPHKKTLWHRSATSTRNWLPKAIWLKFSATLRK